MDLEEQEAIKRVVEEQGTEGVVTLLGAPDPDSAEVFAETVTAGDPTYAGPLAGVPLGLPVYHITEPEVKAAVDPDVYREQVGLMELALDVGPIHERIRAVRERNGISS
jgi:hypothetical protein